MSQVYTVIDIETTGLDHTTEHITEIAAIRVEIAQSGSYREIGRFQTYVAVPDGVGIPHLIKELTGIKADDLRDAPTLYEALTALWFFAGGSVWVAHNAPFDFAFISRIYNNGDFVCTRALSRLLEPNENPSLKPVCSRHGIELNGHHRAMNDAEATVKVLAKLRTIAEINGITYRNVVIDSEERPLTFIPAGAIVRKITKEAV